MTNRTRYAAIAWVNEEEESIEARVVISDRHMPTHFYSVFVRRGLGEDVLIDGREGLTIVGVRQYLSTVWGLLPSTAIHLCEIARNGITREAD